MPKNPLELIHLMKDVLLLGIEVWCLEEHREDIWFLNALGEDIIHPREGLQLFQQEEDYHRSSTSSEQNPGPIASSIPQLPGGGR